jgi:hypothetical protein
MKRVDDLAARSMQEMFQIPPPPKLSVDIKSGWSRFILSLLMRNPEFYKNLKSQFRAMLPSHFAELKATYETWKLPGDPATFDELIRRMRPGELDKAEAILGSVSV